MDEGVTKYHCHWLKDESIFDGIIQDLMQWRDHLYSLGLIGVYDNGIGFGNISIRLEDSLEFIVSGTQKPLKLLWSDLYQAITINDQDLASQQLQTLKSQKISDQKLAIALQVLLSKLSKMNQKK